MKTLRILAGLVVVAALGLFISCDDNGDLVVFSIENDKELGLEVATQIANDSTFNILSETEYPEAYTYLNAMKDEILNSGQVTYKDEFVWKLHIIDDDVLNAFATPGGYIYVYTGLIKYLDKADDLAGVMGHEIAHSDQRHSIKQLQRIYGINILLSVALGENPTALAEMASQIAGNLAGLSFSRDAESEADDYSVVYLAETDYACNGAYSFFQKLIDAKQTGLGPAFLSTHPDPEDRVEDINAKADEVGCDKTAIAEGDFDYDDFKNSLP